MFDKSSWSGVIPEPYKTYFDQSADRWNNYIMYNPLVREQISSVVPGWNGLALKSGGYEEVNDSQTNVIARCGPYNVVDITGGSPTWINAINFSVTVNKHWEGYFGPSDWVNIITHEMGHALGIGIFWQPNFSYYGAVSPTDNFLDGASYSNTQSGYNEVASVTRSKTPLESTDGMEMAQNNCTIEAETEGVLNTESAQEMTTEQSCHQGIQIASSAHWEDNYRESTAPGSGGVGYPGLLDELMVSSIYLGARRVISVISIKNLTDYGYQEKNPGSSEGSVTLNQSVSALSETGIRMECSHPQDIVKIGTIDIGG